MFYILLGAPGSGKGTISNFLIDNKNFKHISTGDIFRKITKKDTPLALNVKNKINNGELIEDELTFNVLVDYFQNFNLKKDQIILDGFPRTKKQAQMLQKYLEDNNLKINKVFNFLIKEEEIIERLGDRKFCPTCSSVYNSKTNKPKKENICDIDGQKLIKREDDAKDKILERLKIYRNTSKDLIDFYSEIIHDINVSKKSINEIGDELIQKII